MRNEWEMGAVGLCRGSGRHRLCFGAEQSSRVRHTQHCPGSAALPGSQGRVKELSHVSLWGSIKQYKWVLCKRILSSALQVLVMKRMHVGSVSWSIKSHGCKIYHPGTALPHHSCWIMNAFYIHICVQNPFAQQRNNSGSRDRFLLISHPGWLH